MIFRSRDGRGDEFLFFNREEPVAVDADYGTCRPYRAQCRFDSSSASAGVVAVDLVAEVVIGICVKAVGKFLSLISLI